MIVKLEAYYELERLTSKPFPEHSRVLLNEKLKEFIPKSINLVDSWWEGPEVVAKLLTSEQLNEKIRTGR